MKGHLVVHRDLDTTSACSEIYTGIAPQRELWSKTYQGEQLGRPFSGLNRQRVSEHYLQNQNIIDQISVPYYGFTSGEPPKEGLRSRAGNMATG